MARAHAVCTLCGYRGISHTNLIRAGQNMLLVESMLYVAHALTSILAVPFRRVHVHPRSHQGWLRILSRRRQRVCTDSYGNTVSIGRKRIEPASCILPRVRASQNKIAFNAGPRFPLPLGASRCGELGWPGRHSHSTSWKNCRSSPIVRDVETEEKDQTEWDVALVFDLLAPLSAS
jgi:hypothetical protein